MTRYTEKQRKDVWDAANVDPEEDCNEYRLDPYGNKIKWDKYGDKTGMGWEIDHIIPRVIFEIDELSNLQAMQSEKNAEIKNSLNKRTRYGITARQLLKIILSKLNS